jgi:hypothetical protein
MKTVCLLLFPVSLLAGIVFVAVTLWMRADVEVVQLNDATLRAAGGMSAVELRELVD